MRCYLKYFTTSWLMTMLRKGNWERSSQILLKVSFHQRVETTIKYILWRKVYKVKVMSALYSHQLLENILTYQNMDSLASFVLIVRNCTRSPKTIKIQSKYWTTTYTPSITPSLLYILYLSSSSGIFLWFQRYLLP